MHMHPIITYVIYMVVCSLLLLIAGMAIVARKQKIPGRTQNAVEMISDALRNTFLAALGPNGERHLPLIFGLFWYIIFCNLIELIPIFKAVTANPSNTIGLGIIVFIYSQYVGITSKGLWNYLKHFAGPVLFLLPLLLPIEIISEVIKPFTLGMRLFGNIYAEDVMHDMAAQGGWILVPVQVIICGLQVFTGLIQAFIFSLLASNYIGLMAETHDDHDESNAHNEPRGELTAAH